jgi:hypothetical protein
LLVASLKTKLWQNPACDAFSLQCRQAHRVDDEAVRRVERGVPDSEAEGLEQRVPELKEQERSDDFKGESRWFSSSFFFFLEATVSR